MKLNDVVSQYIVYRKSLGEDFKSNVSILNAFVRAIGAEIDLDEVRSEAINKFLAGKNPAITLYWHNKYYSLTGFYQYALSRGYVESSPLSSILLPKQPPRFAPYIYNIKELCALLDSCLKHKNKGLIEPFMVYTLILLLYGTGLRIGEAISLTLTDVDLIQGILIIRETKFRKTRLAPIGKSLTQILQQYVKWHQGKRYSQNPKAPFFVGRNGSLIHPITIDKAFQIIRERAGVRRIDGARYQPRLHDLRHTFAVHRLTSWYKQGADVQRLLPILSVYLGHTCIAATSRYLTMTPELLQEAGCRFEQYAFKEDSHV